MGVLRLVVRLVGWVVIALALAVPLANLGLVSLGKSTQADPAFVMWDPGMDESIHSGEGAYRVENSQMWELNPGRVLDGTLVNEDDFRGPRLDREKKSKDVIRIAVIGDSFAMGHTVSDEKSWARLLEGRLKSAGRKVELLNAGVTGHTVVQTEARYRLRVRPFHPDVVLYAGGIYNETSSAPHGRTDRERIAMAGDVWLHFKNSFLGLTVSRVWGHFFSRGTQPDWIASSRSPRVPEAEMAATLRTLFDEIKADGGKVIVLVPFRRNDVYARNPRLQLTDATLRFSAKESGVPVVDLPLCIAKATELGFLPSDRSWVPEFFNDPFHFGEQGHQKISEILSYVLNQPGFLR